jgi:hypothetical protein
MFALPLNNIFQQGIGSRLLGRPPRLPVARHSMGSYLQVHRPRELSVQDSCEGGSWYQRFDKVQGGSSASQEGGRKCTRRRWILDSHMFLLICTFQLLFVYPISFVVNSGSQMLSRVRAGYLQGELDCECNCQLGELQHVFEAELGADINAAKGTVQYTARSKCDTLTHSRSEYSC